MRTRNAQYWIDRTTTFLGGARFAVFALSVLLLYQAFLIVTIFSPSSNGLWGSFATDFRVWCFGYDPEAGTMRWTAVWIMLSEPLLLLGIVGWIWRKQLAQTWGQNRRAMIVPGGAGIFAALLAGAALLLFAAPAETEQDLPFPGERIRTQLPAPQFTFWNQEGQPVSLSDYRGQVVLLTAIYATCGTACPMIVLETRESLESLPEELRSEATILAISLDPEGDTMTRMADASAAYGMVAPQFQFLNGPAEEVNAVLDQLQVGRQFNPATGLIEHANLFFLIDRAGTIAYRFRLSEQHKSWMPEALASLVAEPVNYGPPPGAALSQAGKP